MTTQTSCLKLLLSVHPSPQLSAALSMANLGAEAQILLNHAVTVSICNVTRKREVTAVKVEPIATGVARSSS